MTEREIKYEPVRYEMCYLMLHIMPVLSLMFFLAILWKIMQKVERMRKIIQKQGGAKKKMKGRNRRIKAKEEE